MIAEVWVSDSRHLLFIISLSNASKLFRGNPKPCEHNEILLSCLFVTLERKKCVANAVKISNQLITFEVIKRKSCVSLI